MFLESKEILHHLQMLHAVNPQLTGKQAADALAAALTDTAVFDALADAAAHHAEQCQPDTNPPAPTPAPPKPIQSLRTTDDHAAELYQIRTDLDDLNRHSTNECGRITFPPNLWIAFCDHVNPKSTPHYSSTDL